MIMIQHSHTHTGACIERKSVGWVVSWNQQLVIGLYVDWIRNKTFPLSYLAVFSRIKMVFDVCPSIVEHHTVQGMTKLSFLSFFATSTVISHTHKLKLYHYLVHKVFNKSIGRKCHIPWKSGNGHSVFNYIQDVLQKKTSCWISFKKCNLAESTETYPKLV